MKKEKCSLTVECYQSNSYRRKDGIRKLVIDAKINIWVWWETDVFTSSQPQINISSYINYINYKGKTVIL